MKLLKMIRIVVEIVLVLLVCWLGIQVVEKQRIEQEEIAIDRVYIAFESDICGGKFEEAYELMSPTYRAEHDLEIFTFMFSGIYKSELYWLYPQRTISIDGDEATLYPDGRWDTVAIQFQNVEGKWYLTGEKLVFHD